MDLSTGNWLATLILNNADHLARMAVMTARAQVPWYRSIDPDRLQVLFVRAYQALALSFSTGGIAPMRSYIEQVIPQRLQDGAPAEGLIQVATLLEAGVQQLIARERAADPAQVSGAERQLSTVVKSMRLVISGINLRLLNKLPDLPPPGA